VLLTSDDMGNRFLIYRTLLAASLALLAGLPGAQADDRRRQEEEMGIQTVLGMDAIPAILRPEFVPADRARIDEDSPVIGVSLNGESRAYALRLLNGHEIVNDTVGGEPIAVTW
jgi:hypothetical protein